MAGLGEYSADFPSRFIETSDEHFEPPYDPASLEGLVGFLGELSEQLAPLGFEIKRTREDSDQGLTWITLVNVDAGGDVDKDQAAGLAQLASDLTPLEISFYREIVSQLFSLHVSAGSAEVGGAQKSGCSRYPQSLNRIRPTRLPPSKLLPSAKSCQVGFTFRATETSIADSPVPTAAYSTAQAERALKVLVSRGWLQQSKSVSVCANSL